MSNFSKIVIIILLVLSFLFIKEKYGDEIFNFIAQLRALPKVEIPEIKKTETVEIPEEIPTEEATTLINKEKVSVYFLALDSNDNGIYKKVTRDVIAGEDKFDFAIKELLKGPNLVEKSLGAYSEIPKNTKLLGIKHKGNKIIIDLNSDFQYGGGTDSIYSRMMQLIETAINNSDNKKIYLYLDGEQVNFIGGEGIMITQPLNEKSLEI